MDSRRQYCCTDMQQASLSRVWGQSGRIHTSCRYSVACRRLHPWMGQLFLDLLPPSSIPMQIGSRCVLPSSSSCIPSTGWALFQGVCSCRISGCSAYTWLFHPFHNIYQLLPGVDGKFPIDVVNMGLCSGFRNAEVVLYINGVTAVCQQFENL